MAGTTIDKIEARVKCAGHPSLAPAVEDGVGVFGPRFRARLAGVRLGVPAPVEHSSLWIERLKETPNVRNVPGDTDNHVIANNKRGHRREVAEFWIGELDDPADAAILCVETDQVGVGRSKVEPILVRTQAAIANVVPFGRTLVVPDLPPNSRMDVRDFAWR